MQNKTHIGTYGIIKKGDQVLLIKKARGPYKGMFDLPGGSLEHGEDIAEALIREINEETGLEASKVEWDSNLTTTVDFRDKRGDISMYHIGLIYKVTKFSGKIISEMSEEDSLGAEWFKITDLHKESLSPFAKLAVNNSQP
ncbi:NUDIX hydrolase [Candidatus Uhrbacteria bacterium]|jgi:8-oxo-dGTP diphosphatase|nr:NUDIX hydrolase [Candidatus Uhrbacteria bacterium]